MGVTFLAATDAIYRVAQSKAFWVTHFLVQPQVPGEQIWDHLSRRSSHPSSGYGPTDDMNIRGRSSRDPIQDCAGDADPWRLGPHHGAGFMGGPMDDLLQVLGMRMSLMCDHAHFGLVSCQLSLKMGGISI